MFKVGEIYRHKVEKVPLIVKVIEIINDCAYLELQENYKGFDKGYKYDVPTSSEY